MATMRVQCWRSKLPMNLTSVGTSRCDVPARESAGRIVAPLNAARTAQRAVPTMFRGSMRENLFRIILSMESPSTALWAPSPPVGEKDGMRGYRLSNSICLRPSLHRLDTLTHGLPLEPCFNNPNQCVLRHGSRG